MVLLKKGKSYILELYAFSIMATEHQYNLNTNNSGGTEKDPAVDFVRQKIAAIYDHEPNAREEAKEVSEQSKPLSEHQAYMKQLTNSGLSLADIQTKWHQYYTELSDEKKHQVWQEFYAEYNKNKHSPTHTHDIEPENIKPEISIPQVSEIQPEVSSQTVKHRHKRGTQTVSQIKHQLLGKAESSAKRKLTRKQNFQSLLFGVGLGSVVLIIMLFSFFNERFIAPFITPSRQVSSTPIIINGSTSTSDTKSKIIIPKINVEIPVIYDEPSIEEDKVQHALERGVVHYGNTPNAGEKGNAVIFGHSSNNILNSGKYKFAFVLLNRLSDGDTFYLTKDGTRYAYKVYSRKIVKPNEVGVLGSTDKAATVTLITCDPPGTSLNRLVVIGEQISPDPLNNKTSSVKTSSDKPSIIPSNAPSLWDRITNWFR